MRVPKFASLKDFMIARKWYYRALYMPGPERSDFDIRFKRHRILVKDCGATAPPAGESFDPQILNEINIRPTSDPHQTHIRPTLDTH